MAFVATTELLICGTHVFKEILRMSGFVGLGPYVSTVFFMFVDFLLFQVK